jgi:hypothetical protein
VILLIESLEFMCYHALKALQPGYDLIDQPEILRGLSSQNGDDVENDRIFAEAHGVVLLVMFVLPASCWACLDTSTFFTENTA